MQLTATLGNTIVVGAMPANTSTTSASTHEQVVYAMVMSTIRILVSVSPSLAGKPVLAYMIAQVMLESGDFTSNLSRIFHNLSGIRPNKHGFTNGATDMSGPFKKKNEFATYANDTMWAKDYIRILQMPPGVPINATSANDFYTRLARNGYFLPSEGEQYKKLFNAKIKLFNHLVTMSQNPNSSVADVDKLSKNAYDQGTAQGGLQEWWGGLSFPVKAGIIGGGALLVIVAIKS